MSAFALHDSSSAAYKKARRIHYKTTKNRDSAADADWTPFRTAEKYYKARFPPPSLVNVLDLATLDEERSAEIEAGFWHGNGDTVSIKELDTHGGTKVYSVPSIPGLVVLPSFLSEKEQKSLIKWALRDQARHPNPTNLDVHYAIPHEGLWNMHLRSRKDTDADTVVLPLPPTAQASSAGPRELINNPPASTAILQTLLSTPKPDAQPSPSTKATSASELCKKLRWANIGYFYHWGVKQYDLGRGKAPIDTTMRDICQAAVRAVDWKQVFEDVELDWGDEQDSWRSWRESYEPDAGIVNFYQTKDTLMAHVDRSEVCATAPLVSISLGHASVFLIGGQTRDTEPVPILLRSGDVVIMSGPACRRAYHGVPRILEGTLPPHLHDECDENWAPYLEYLKTARINVNVRQVFPKGFDPSQVGLSI
ncbi:hypothetical protein CYLTODRAFT_442295 [Cylindrobasidium torrendii FP15055 ss-10]|uniref:Fe2OG dioxygenase domain-containing protein n=1 Tax=Cylindrobasidium torrendii FP15055 ss-10 TaxID=1314674 RepID=A0A0D7BIB8_9AGAR|nr:hypothetical protein CYLTODRAFT_442295 [Cylindrobasidium torrendii FP15055 ss-10]